MKLFSRTLRVGILGLALTLLNCQQLMDLLDEKNKVDETAATTNTDLDKAGSWTILVYLDADNNLEGAGVGDVVEMMGAFAGLGNNKVYVLMDRIQSAYSTASFDVSCASGGTSGIKYDTQGIAYLFEITSATSVNCTGTVPTGFTQNTEPNMGDGTLLKNFVIWGLQKAQSNNSDYVYLDIWDHGAGWGGGAYSGNAVAWDDSNSHDELTIS